MLLAEERRERAAQFGVPEEQIVRDHLVSHVLHALSRLEGEELTFFGGTALCRTYCPDSRLSEDIDLLVEDHIRSSDELPALLSKGIRREFPAATWSDMGRRHGVDTKTLRDGIETSVRVQFVRWRADWRTLALEPAPVLLRYADLPPSVRLTVPTPDSFVAMKCLAWQDRQAPRDLFDLAQLARRGYVSAQALDAVRKIGGVAPSAATFGDEVPQDVSRTWDAELRNQVGELPTAAACWKVVLDALNAVRRTS